MADFAKLLGTLLSSLAHARRIADEETAAIAEYYKSNPLLEGMSLPRVRVPEMTLDLPVVMESIQEGEPAVPQNKDVIKDRLRKALRESARAAEIGLSEDFAKRFDSELDRQLSLGRQIDSSLTLHLRETDIRAVDKALNTVLKQLPTEFTQEQKARIAEDLRRRAAEEALKTEGVPSRLEATIVTSEVKEKAAAGNVVRLRLTMREEGLEWSVAEASDGSIKRNLTPE